MAENSIVFDNYFNHTAATFRGLRGQMMSGHQAMDGYTSENDGLGQKGAKEYIRPSNASSLPKILKKYGYDSYFYISQQNHLFDMLEVMDFNRVYGRDSLRRDELPDSNPDAPILSDRELFKAVLSSLEKKNAKSEKFFAGIYNFDTHTGLDGEYKYARGRNAVLNRFHTYDVVLGEFVENLRDSSLFDNTTLIITADHSTFPDVAAVRADSSVPHVFVDKVPFLIYQKDIVPQRLDAGNQNTLAFAPTLMDFLNAHNENATFIGCSLMEVCRENFYSTVGNEYFSTENGFPRLLDMENLSEADQEMVGLIKESKMITGFYQLGGE